MEEAKLISVGKAAKRLKERILSLNSDQKEFVLGRNREAQCMILDVNVSRRHAALKFDNSKQIWTIIDNKSTNGIYINSKKIPPETRIPIQNGDKVSLGPDGSYEWKFEVVRKADETKEMTQSMNEFIDEKLKKTMDRFEEEKEALEKRVDQEKAAQESLKNAKVLLELELKIIEEKQKKENEEFEKKLFATKEIGEQQKIELEKRLEQERQEFNSKRESLESKITESEGKMEKLLLEKDESVKSLQREKEKMEEILQNERENFAENLKKLQQENETFNLQRAQDLQQEFVQKLQKSQEEFELAVQLEKSEREEERQKLAQELEQKEEKIQKLNAQLKETEDSNVKKMKVELLKKCNDELKCTICDELFIMPMTLNCGHVFCQFCITQWERRCDKKPDFTCPNCRQPITSFSRSMQLENLISAIYRDIDESLSKERENLIQERKAEIEKAEKEKKKCVKKKKNTGNIRDWAANVSPQLQPSVSGQNQSGVQPE